MFFNNKMLICIFFIAILVSVSKPICSQNGFSRTYHGSSNSFAGKKLFNTNDGGYILIGEGNDELIIIKTDSLGYKIWDRIFEARYITEHGSCPVAITEEGELILFTTSPILSQSTEMNLIKLDKDGNVLWNKPVGFNGKYICSDIIINTDSCIYATCKKVGDNYYSWILKFDNLGNEIWNKSFQLSMSTEFGYRLIKSKEEKVLLLGQNKVDLIDRNGERLWEYDVGNEITAAEIYNDIIYICTMESSQWYSKVNLITMAGNYWKRYAIFGKVLDINIIPGNGFVITRENNSEFYLVKLNDEFIEESKYKTWDVIHFVQEEDDRFVGIGKLGNNVWFLKTDQAFSFDGIEILSPVDFSTINPFAIFTVEFLSRQAEFVNIDLSIDNGAGWNNIASNFNATTSNFKWGILNFEADSCYLRISDRSNPHVYGLSGKFKIQHHKRNSSLLSAYDAKMYISNNGMSAHNPNSDSTGYFIPRANGKELSLIYMDGIVYGGKINGSVVVGGSTYRHGWQPGPISGGVAENPDDIKYKIYKIKKEWDILPDGFEKSVYEYDFENWPGDLGAPFVDINGDKMYTKDVDQPKLIGDEQLFFVSNDLDGKLTNNLYGSPPIGLEIQTLLYSFEKENPVCRVVFKKLCFINKSSNNIEDMFISYWSDDDIGNPNDDFVGFDASLNLGYTYNADSFDDGNFLDNPPAVGHLLLQGPKVPGALTDTARFKGNWIKGYKNLPVTSFTFYLNASMFYADPSFGDYSGSRQIYYNMNGLNGNGEYFLDPGSGETVKYCLSGDPVKKIGWYEGGGWSNGAQPGDRRYLMSSGPFTLAPGDTQEVIYAIYTADGSNNIGNIDLLKLKANDIIEFNNRGYLTGMKNENGFQPYEFRLSQNFPNPFNPATEIEYSVPSTQFVTLHVFDVLGRKVAILVSEEKKPGKYKVEFNGSGLASGIYFYCLTAGSSWETKKCLLLK